MLRKSHLSLAVSAALGLTAMPAVQAQEGAALEEVVVTGSRIQKANLVSSNPVVQVDAEELKFQGTTRVEDMMKNLPQVYSNQNTSQSNGATGTATLNLRNLGDERTLVLINGRRMPAGSPIQGGVGADINQIPGALIKNVEILTGGASATYGSDAVAGVVNFIMVDDFEGIKFDYQFSQYNHDNDNSFMQDLVTSSGFPVASSSKSDGDISDLSLIIGGNFEGGRGNATAYATYRKVDEVKQNARDYSGCALSGDATACGGSGTTPEGTFIIGGDQYRVSGTDFIPRDGNVYNYGPENFYQRPDKRYTGGFFAHYDVNEHVEAYAEGMFMDNQTLSQIAPSGAFFLSLNTPCSNPLLSDSQVDLLCTQQGLGADDSAPLVLGRRNVEGGPRQQDLRHTTWRGVFGLRGDINDVWRYDAYMQYSEVSMENTYQNDLNNDFIADAIDVVADADGNPVCASGSASCVPWNVWTTGGVTSEQSDALALPLFARGTTTQKVFSGYVAGDLGEYGIKLPSAESGINVVVGAEYREEELDFSPDYGFQNGLGAGQGGATNPVNGSYDVTEFFVEASIPLIEGKRFVEELTLDAGYRYSDYSTDVDTDTYGVRMGWAVTQGVKLRASYQRAVRAANIQELFLPQGFNLFDMDGDPCGPNMSASAADCARTGLSAAQYGDDLLDSPAGQYNYLQGGNPDLEPEEADTYTAGIVWTPEFADGLSLTVDYYDIKIEQGINNLNPEFILNECLDGDDTQCGKVRRGNLGTLWIGSDVNNSGRVVALQDNLATERVKGWDFIADYSLELNNYGSLGFNNNMAIIDTWDQQELDGAPTVDCKGQWGATCGYPTPDFRNNLRVTWTTPWNLTVSTMWRHIGEVEDQNGLVDIDKQDYFDLAGIWDINETVQLRAGMNNLTDEEPPIVGGNAGPSNQGNGNTFPGMYDALGRYYYLAVGVGF